MTVKSDGSTDATPTADGSTPAPAAVAVPQEWLDGVLTELRKPVVVAPAAVPVEDPTAAAQRDYDERFKAAKAQAATLFAEGKYEEAIDAVASVRPPALPPRDLTTDPLYAELVDSAIDRAARKSKTPDVFEQYNDEIRAGIAALPENKRLLASEIAKVATAVRATHVDDIIAATVREQVAATLAAGGSLEPQTAPSAALGENADTALHGLDRAERQQARELGVDYAAYAASKRAFDHPVDAYGTVDIPS